MRSGMRPPTGAADFILPVRALASRLADLIQAKPRIGLASKSSKQRADDELLRRILAHARPPLGYTTKDKLT